MQTLHPLDKEQWYRSARELRAALAELRQARFEQLLANMDYTKDASYSNWSFTKNIKTQPKRINPLQNAAGNWCRSSLEQAQIFADHLAQKLTAFNTASQEEVGEILRRPFQTRGLLATVKLALPANHYSLIRSFPAESEFEVQCRESISSSRPLNAGVPQGSLLGPMFYSIFSADTPTPDATEMDINREKMLLATFADDVCILYSADSEYGASDGIQEYLN